MVLNKLFSSFFCTGQHLTKTSSAHIFLSWSTLCQNTICSLFMFLYWSTLHQIPSIHISVLVSPSPNTINLYFCTGQPFAKTPPVNISTLVNPSPKHHLFIFVYWPNLHQTSAHFSINGSTLYQTQSVHIKHHPFSKTIIASFSLSFIHSFIFIYLIIRLFHQKFHCT